MHDLWLFKHDAPLPTLARELAGLRNRIADLRSWQALDESTFYSMTRHEPSGLADIDLAGDWHRLRCVQDLAGASAGSEAPNHYIVETDVLAEFEDDLNAWYADEHLPGLAAVPGTVRAARYVDDAGSPRYYACYDLTHAQVLGSPAWLAVRETPWSARVRPAFRNTRRTMFRRADRV